MCVLEIQRSVWGICGGSGGISLRMGRVCPRGPLEGWKGFYPRMRRGLFRGMEMDLLYKMRR